VQISPGSSLAPPSHRAWRGARPAQRRPAGAGRSGAQPPGLVQSGMTLREMEGEWITMALAAMGGNKKATAQMLGISRRALYNKLKRHGLL